MEVDKEIDLKDNTKRGQSLKAGKYPWLLMWAEGNTGDFSSH